MKSAWESLSAATQAKYYDCEVKYQAPELAHDIVDLITAYANSGVYIGQNLDCFDRTRWYISKVTEINEKQAIVRIHYYGWDDKWDRYLSHSEFLEFTAPPFTRTEIGKIGDRVAMSSLHIQKIKAILNLAREFNCPVREVAAIIAQTKLTFSSAINRFLFMKEMNIPIDSSGITPEDELMLEERVSYVLALEN
jgi:hypothetical protein